MTEGDPYADAERLMRDAQRAAAAAAAAGGDEPPPRGWDVPRGDRPPAFPDVTALLALLESLRGTVPPELLQPLADALRDLLVALRAILDYAIARLERAPGEPVPVEDIPVE